MIENIIILTPHQSLRDSFPSRGSLWVVQIYKLVKVYEVLLELYGKVKENLCLEEKDVPEDLYLD